MHLIYLKDVFPGCFSTGMSQTARVFEADAPIVAYCPFPKTHVGSPFVTIVASLDLWLPRE